MSTEQALLLIITSYNAILEKYLITRDKMKLCKELKALIEISASTNLLDIEYNGFNLRRSYTDIIKKEGLFKWLENRKRINVSE